MRPEAARSPFECRSASWTVIPARGVRNQPALEGAIEALDAAAGLLSGADRLCAPYTVWGKLLTEFSPTC